MLTIDKETPNLICIQIPLAERQDFVEKIKKLLTTGSAYFAALAGAIHFVLSDSEFKVEANSFDEIVITLPEGECIGLIESVREHIEDDMELPLDYSLESFGALLIPESLKDIVIETI